MKQKNKRKKQHREKKKKRKKEKQLKHKPGHPHPHLRRDDKSSHGTRRERATLGSFCFGKVQKKD